MSLEGSFRRESEAIRADYERGNMSKEEYDRAMRDLEREAADELAAEDEALRRMAEQEREDLDGLWDLGP